MNAKATPAIAPAAMLRSAKESGKMKAIGTAATLATTAPAMAYRVTDVGNHARDIRNAGTPTTRATAYAVINAEKKKPMK